MQIEITNLLEDTAVKKRENEWNDERSVDDFREKLLKAKAAYKRRARKREYDRAAEKYQEKRRMESAIVQELETLRLRNIKAVNFENFRKGTKKGPLM